MGFIIDETVYIDAPAEVVWQVLTDLPSYGEWNPFVSRCESTLVPGVCAGVRARSSIAHRNAASVLPEPVGATTRVSSPSAIAAQACACAAVGAGKVAPNQSRVSGLNRAIGSDAAMGTIVPPWCDK